MGNANEKEILKKQLKMSRMRHQERKERQPPKTLEHCQDKREARDTQALGTKNLIRRLEPQRQQERRNSLE